MKVYTRDELNDAADAGEPIELCFPELSAPITIRPLVRKNSCAGCIGAQTDQMVNTVKRAYVQWHILPWTTVPDTCGNLECAGQVWLADTPETQLSETTYRLLGTSDDDA